ncbi:ABC transporter ATP-binding protein [Marinospirillum sp. MEB164]|uniref:ABC transporter ATP-binding protein n=1 Tax=Marinospirillum alkalitolerans TaxID=3123374 RepID=A0ABW8PWQ2_9GAMM
MIHVQHLSKHFKLYAKPSDRLKEVFLRRPLHTTHIALRDISFHVQAGETLGILGQNGAGKSTLLKLLSGVLLPDAGQLDIQGRVTGLLELGTGFDLQLTGRQNIMTNGLLIGMSATEIHERESSIIEFAELGAFIDEPLRTYSSGMTMRLAFAIAIHAQPQAFLIDEALSVGDGHFQQKCIKRIRQFKEQGGAIIFVSHDLNAVKQICDRALVLDAGDIVYEGDPESAVNAYNRILARLDEATAEQESAARRQHAYGTKEAVILDATLVGQDSLVDLLSSGEQAHFRVTYMTQKDLPKLTLGFVIRDRFGQDVFGINTHYLQQSLPSTTEQRHCVEFAFPMHLAPGKYTLTLALHGDEHHLEACYHWVDNYLTFEVAGLKNPPFAGLTYLPTQLVNLHSEPHTSQSQPH